MERVDAKKEMDDLFKDLSDVTHFIGTIQVSSGSQGAMKKIAFVRLLFPMDAPLRPWPAKLTYRRAVEATSGIIIFAIYEPGPLGVLEPFVATEWEDCCQQFVEAAQREHLFCAEVVTPVKQCRALVIDGEVTNISECTITPEDYQFLQNAYSAPTPIPRS
jgi:hypothetical protein